MKTTLLHFCFLMLLSAFGFAQPNWPAIKNNATFYVADTTYAAPYLQPIQVGGWEDGLNITRDGKHLFSTYLPIDALSWITDLLLNPFCFNFDPYYRGPLIGIDTLTNIFGCPNYMHSDIIKAYRSDTSQAFGGWTPSNLQTAFSFDGGANGVLLNADTFDVFVYTKDGIGTQSTDIMFMRNVPVNPTTTSAVSILSTTGQEDNPHIERISGNQLVLIFDRDRYMHYSISNDNGTTWQTPVLITNVLNDQAPYDVQPHLYNDGTDWWVYFCADNTSGVRCIYKSKQLIANDWNSWGAKELILQPTGIAGGHGNVMAIGEPTLTAWGDLSFVVVYGNTLTPDTTDVLDCDPWYMPKKQSILTGMNNKMLPDFQLQIFPNPANEIITISAGQSYTASTEIRLYNALGMLIKKAQSSLPAQFSVEDLPAGIYFIQCNEHAQTIRFVKN
ncbi:MAG: T9SS type A sorting domain-containing protein [Bacteroidetes bacterium]|nr:T9SS type A sorting domain-containing protein [Bacteroidota bacterium]